MLFIKLEKFIILKSMEYYIKQISQFKRISIIFLIMISSLIVFIKIYKIGFAMLRHLKQNFTKTNQIVTYKIKNYRPHTIISLKLVSSLQLLPAVFAGTNVSV